MQNKITDFISFQYPVFLSFLLYFFIDFNELRFSVVSSLSTMDSTKAEEAKLFLFTQDNAAIFISTSVALREKYRYSRCMPS